MTEKFNHLHLGVDLSGLEVVVLHDGLRVVHSRRGRRHPVGRGRLEVLLLLAGGGVEAAVVVAAARAAFINKRTVIARPEKIIAPHTHMHTPMHKYYTHGEGTPTTPRSSTINGSEHPQQPTVLV